MIRIIDTSFFCSDKPLAVQVKEHATALGYIEHLHGRAEVEVIKHGDREETAIINGIKFSQFKSRNRFFHTPSKTIRYINTQRPHVVILQGLVYPVQLARLRKELGESTVILVQHHGERPFGGIKRWFQQKAARCATGFLFTGLGNADEWISHKIIPDKNACFGLLEASTYFSRGDWLAAKKRLGLDGNMNFLWVGRLNEGKDPMAVIRAFERFAAAQPFAKLFLFYHTEELLPQIKKLLAENEHLLQHLILKGCVSHEELEDWYNAADYYLSGSHHEGSGYALLEAMACGCIPVVTDIPSFSNMTNNGEFGFLYEAGNSEALYQILVKLQGIHRDQFSSGIIDHFQKNLSFKSIADRLYVICSELIAK